MPVIFTREPTARKASAPSGSIGGASAHPQASCIGLDEDPITRPATSAPAAPLKNCRRFMPAPPGPP